MFPSGDADSRAASRGPADSASRGQADSASGLPRGETVALRLLAGAASLAGLVVLVRAVGIALESPPGESGMRLVARTAFGLTLLYAARLGWNRPAGRAQRLRRRILKTVAVLGSANRQREYLESAPSVSLPTALLGDWRRLTGGDRSALSEGAFDREERAELEVLREDLLELATHVASTTGGAADLRLTETDAAWRAITDRVARTHDFFARRAGEPTSG